MRRACPATNPPLNRNPRNAYFPGYCLVAPITFDEAFDVFAEFVGQGSSQPPGCRKCYSTCYTESREEFYLDNSSTLSMAAGKWATAMVYRLAPYLRCHLKHRPTDDNGIWPSVLVVFDNGLTDSHFSRVAREDMELVVWRSSFDG